MDTPAPLVVGYDGSGSAGAACAYARVLTARTGAETILVHAGDDAAAQAGLAREAARFVTPVRTRQVSASPADALCAEATSSGASLVLIGSIGRGALGRALFGSVSSEILRRRTGPVLVAHEPVDAIRLVVAAVDADSVGDPRVADAARTVAAATGADLAWTHVLAADVDMAAHPQAYGISGEQWEATLQGERDRVFGPLRGATPAAEILRFGWAPDAIRALANERKAELVVVGRRGHTGRGVDHLWSVAATLAARGPFATLIA